MSARPAARRADALPFAARGAGGEGRGEADARLLVERTARELAELALAADDLQRAFGPVVAAAAARDPGFLGHAQVLDLLTQSLRGVSAFLDAAGRQRIGREALDFDAAAAAVPLARLGARLAGRDEDAPAPDVELF